MKNNGLEKFLRSGTLNQFVFYFPECSLFIKAKYVLQFFQDVIGPPKPAKTLPSLIWRLKIVELFGPLFLKLREAPGCLYFT